MFDVKKAREICNLATPGPWKPVGSEMDCEHIGDCPKGKYDYDDDCAKCEDNSYITGAWLNGPKWIDHDDYSYFTDADAEFIAFARTSLPEALDEIERLQTENKRTEEKYNLVNKLLFGDMTVSFAAIDAIKERQRQVEQEKFSAERDNQYTEDELVRAAAVYALPENIRHYLIKYQIGVFAPKNITDNLKNMLWPWSEKWWKPSPDNRRRELIKAAALIIAEIERLDRKESCKNARL